MPWVIVDVALVLSGLVVVLLCGLSLYRSVKGLAREVSAAGAALAAGTDELARLQAEGAARVRPTPVEAALPRPVTSRSPRRRR